MQAGFSCSFQRSKHDRSPIRVRSRCVSAYTRTQRQDRAVKLHSFTVLTCHLTLYYSNISKFSTLYTATFPLSSRIADSASQLHTVHNRVVLQVQRLGQQLQGQRVLLAGRGKDERSSAAAGLSGLRSSLPCSHHVVTLPQSPQRP